MPAARSRLWRVRFELTSWNADLRAASATARGHAERWRLGIEIAGGIPQHHLLATRADDDEGLGLPNCVKTRIPDPGDDDPRRSPWGAVLRGAVDTDGPYLAFLAFGLRHPEPTGRLPSVYQRAHRRLNAT